MQPIYIMTRQNQAGREQSGCHPQKHSPNIMGRYKISQSFPEHWDPRQPAIALPGHQGLENVHLPILLSFLFLRPCYKETLLHIQTPWPSWCSHEAQWKSSEFLSGTCLFQRLLRLPPSAHTETLTNTYCCFLHFMERIKKTGR